MSLVRLRFGPVAEARARLVAGVLGEIAEPCPAAVSLFETSPGRWAVDAFYDAEADHGSIRAALDIAAPGEASTGEIEPVENENWVAISQAGLPPVEAGRLIVHGSHDRARARSQRRLAIEIDAGEAFGTAHHASTLGCLILLDRLIRARRFTRVLDLGCGSGVLAIAAAKLMPAARVDASDNDPEAVRVAADNARKNGLGSRIRPVVAAGLQHPFFGRPESFDLVIANILAGPLVILAPAIARALSPGGIVILSGILSHEAASVVARYRSLGLVVTEIRHAHGWAALSLARSPTRRPEGALVRPAWKA